MSAVQDSLEQAQDFIRLLRTENNALRKQIQELQNGTTVSYDQIFVPAKRAFCLTASSRVPQNYHHMKKWMSSSPYEGNAIICKTRSRLWKTKWRA